jgi:hypothetical protein
VIQYQENAWMTSDLTERWLQSIYRPMRRNESDILIMDSFSGHISKRVKSFCRENHIKIAIIPGGCTPHLQPLNISVNRSFKARFRQKWKAWIASRVSTSQGNRLLPMDLHALTRAIRAVWSELNPQTIINGFQKARIQL